MNEDNFLCIKVYGISKQDAINEAYKQLEDEAKKLGCILPVKPYQPMNYVSCQPVDSLWYGTDINMRTTNPAPMQMTYTYQSSSTADVRMQRNYPAVNMIMHQDYKQDAYVFEQKKSLNPFGETPYSSESYQRYTQVPPCNCPDCMAIRGEDPFNKYKPFHLSTKEATEKIAKAFNVGEQEIGIIKDEARNVNAKDIEKLIANMSLADGDAYLYGEYDKIKGLKTPMYQYKNPDAAIDESNDPNDKSGNTQPLVAKQTALALLEQGKSCTDGIYTIIVSDLDTFRVMQEISWHQVYCAAKTDFKDRINELKELRNDIEDLYD